MQNRYGINIINLSVPGSFCFVIIDSVTKTSHGIDF
jgi:hypothetical protein